MPKWMMIVLALSTTVTVAHAQDPAAGQNSFALCAICHAVGEGAQNKLGPILNGLDGRRSGSVQGYDYSEAMKMPASFGARPHSKSSSQILPRKCLARR
jgi:cytochrome c2